MKQLAPRKCGACGQAIPPPYAGASLKHTMTCSPRTTLCAIPPPYAGASLKRLLGRAEVAWRQPIPPPYAGASLKLVGASMGCQ